MNFNLHRVRAMAGLPSLPIIKEDKSPEEYATREKMISKIEGYFGDLQTVPYDKISSADLLKIYDKLIEKNQIKE